MTDFGYRVLCRLEDLADGESRGFSVDLPDGLVDLFLVRRGDVALSK